ncbi:MAG: hypothetical protein CMB64_04745 [Euryarchaeota archaeon]|nr:hypothetical protein [Euryarchaeota archaeon]|tara:strand:+ start:295 stop:780 length:486 start_codon:yes stop_codon:yes gene_type:complete
MASDLRYIDSDIIDETIANLPPVVIDKRVMKLLFTKQYKQRTGDWYDKRNMILTASDCAAALDQNPYQKSSRTNLLRKKSKLSDILDKKEDLSNNKAILHGNKYEDEAAEIYATQNPHLAPFFEIGLVMHEKHPFLGASPDRVTKDGICIEIKVHTNSFYF